MVRSSASTMVTQSVMPSLPALLSLTYVPNYFDILPMYIGVLLLVPLVVAARGVSVRVASIISPIGVIPAMVSFEKGKP